VYYVKPFGEDRYSYGTTPTTYRFTGQRIEASIGLYYYGARWYDSQLGRFLSADSIIPGAGNPQAWDRYAGMMNNPLRYTDPSGHAICDADGYCDSKKTADMVLHQYGVTTSGTWSERDKLAVLSAVVRLGIKFALTLGGMATDAFRTVYDHIEFEMYDGQCAEGCWGRAIDAHHIRFYRHFTATATIEDPNNPGKFIEYQYEANTTIIPQLAIHELGHSFESATVQNGWKPRDILSYTDMTDDRDGLAYPLWAWQQSEEMTAGEIFADMFIGWVYGMWDYKDHRVDASTRSTFMEKFIPIWLAISR
jgi:RHS repeat-associated protein